MKFLLLFVIANALGFATVTATFRPRPNQSAYDWLNQIENLFTKHLTNLPAYRPQGQGPPSQNDVAFWCVKPKQKEIQQVTINDPNVALKLDFSKPINFLIHGWFGLVQDDGSVPFKNDAIKWARFSEINACTVDWSRLSRYNYSTAATKHLKIVSAATVNFMRFLTQYGMNVQQVSIVGFSLGAHIAGFIGASFPQQKLAAIYGLDPAGPGFTMPADYGVSERLDPTDASYVQCVFTNQLILGSGIDCGHGNFFMNGGMCQPGCLLDVNCSHQRAHAYFNESFNPKRNFIGERCVNAARKLFLELLGKRCSNVTDRMGPYTAHKKGRFFVKTSYKFPYSLA